MSVAATRVDATRRRLAELRERISRLRNGEPATHADVERARAAARAQLGAARRAYLRLLDTRAAAASHGWVLARPAGEPVAPAGPQELHNLIGENQRLRDALVAIQTAPTRQLPWPVDRRRWMWRALVDECHSGDWRSWSLAVCSVATRLIPVVRGAALTLYDEHRTAYPLAASNRWAREMEEIHELVGEGPALEVSSTRRSVVVAEISDAYARWPGFVESAASAGLHGLSTFFVPLGECVTGSLTFYYTMPASLDDTSWADMALLADVAGDALVADVEALGDTGVNTGFGQHRDVDIATGILSVQLNISVAEAYDELRASAYGDGSGLSDAARAVIRRSLDQG